MAEKETKSNRTKWIVVLIFLVFIFLSSSTHALTLGYQDATYGSYGSGSVNMGTDDTFVIPLTIPSSINVNSISVKLYGASGNVVAVIYSDSNSAPNSRLYVSPATSFTDNSWVHIATNYNLTGNTQFWFGVLASTGCWAYGTNQASTGTNHGGGWLIYPNPQNPFGTYEHISATMSLYVNYTVIPPPAPVLNYIGHTSEVASSTTNILSKWTPSTGLTMNYSWIESNVTGSVSNTTIVAFAGSYSNNSLALTVSGTVQYRQFVNDSYGNVAVSSYNLLSVKNTSDMSLHVCGNQIFNVNGTSIILKGMGYTYFVNTPNSYYGTWMMPDGSKIFYTWSTSGVQNLLDFFQASNANVARVFMTAEYWLQNTGDFQNYIKYFATEATKRGIYTDITFWNANGTGQMPNGVLPWQDGNNIINSSTDFVNLWENISTTLKNYPSVIFELWNEPNGDSTAETLWFNVTQQCINRIRSVGATQPILIHWNYQINYDFGGGWHYGMDWVFNHPLNDPAVNLIYSTHIYSKSWYGFYNATNGTMVTDYLKIDYALAQCRVYEVSALHPIFIGEIGNDLWDSTIVNGARAQDIYYNNTLTLLDLHGIGYAAFAAPPWSSATQWGLVIEGAANYTLNSAGVILVNHLGGMNYSDWLNVQHSAPRSKVFGTLLDANGNPIQQAKIIAYQGSNIINSTQTSASGTYSLSVNNGTYDIQFNISSFYIKMLSVDLSSDIGDLINNINKDLDTMNFVSNRNTQIFQILSASPTRVLLNNSEIAINTSLNDNTYYYSNGVIYLKLTPGLISDCIYQCCSNESRYRDKLCPAGQYCLNRVCK